MSHLWLSRSARPRTSIGRRGRLVRPIAAALVVLLAAGVTPGVLLAAEAQPPTITFPVPAKIVIGGSEVSWPATLTNPADGANIEEAFVRIVIVPHGHAHAADLALSLLPTGQTDRIDVPLTDESDGTIQVDLNGQGGFPLPADTTTGAQFFLRVGSGATAGTIQVGVVVETSDGNGGRTQLAGDDRSVHLVKPHGPTVSLDRSAVEPGGSVKVSVTGFKPGSTVKLDLHSSVIALGSIKVGTSGSGSATVTIPAGVTGAHTIVARGRSTTGAQASVSAAVQVGLPDSATVPNEPGPGGSGRSAPAILWLVLTAAAFVATGLSLRRRLGTSQVQTDF